MVCTLSGGDSRVRLRGRLQSVSTDLFRELIENPTLRARHKRYSSATQSSTERPHSCLGPFAREPFDTPWAQARRGRILDCRAKPPNASVV